MNFFWAVGCVTRNKRLDYGGDLHFDVDPRIFKGFFYHCWMGAIVRILWDHLLKFAVSQVFQVFKCYHLRLFAFLGYSFSCMLLVAMSLMVSSSLSSLAVLCVVDQMLTKLIRSFIQYWRAIRNSHGLVIRKMAFHCRTWIWVLLSPI